MPANTIDNNSMFLEGNNIESLPHEYERYENKNEQRDSTLPSLDEYLVSRQNLDEPTKIRSAKISGIDFHVPSLAALEFMSIGLLLSVVFLNFFLNYDSGIFETFERELVKIGWNGNIYINTIFFTFVIIIIAWAYNFIKHIPEKMVREKYRKLSQSLFVLFVTIFFIILFIYLIVTYGNYGFLLDIQILLLTPIMFGILGIITKVRGYLFLSFFGILFTILIYFNDKDELFSLVLFAAVLFLYFDISDTSIKLSRTSHNLWPARDEADIQLVNETAGRYLINLFILISASCIIIVVLFNLQLILSFLMPPQIVYSIEFSSPITLFLLFIIFSILIVLMKKYIPEFLIKKL